MSNLLELAELEGDLAPQIIPVDARLSVRIDKADLLPLFERATALAPAKEVIAGSSYALLESQEATPDTEAYIRITATDGEQTVSIQEFNVRVAVSGRVLLTAKRIVDILKLAPEPLVKLEVLGDRATILSGRAQWTVATPSGESLPPLPNVETVKMVQVPTLPFLKALAVTRKAVAGSYRPTLMQADVAVGKITTSDGGRLHRQTVEGLPENLTFTIPVKVMDELMKSLRSHPDEHFKLGVNDYHLSFQFGKDTLIASRLLTPYPNVENMLLEPAFNNQDQLTVDRKALGDVISRVRVNADQDYASVFLALVPGKPDDEGNSKTSLAVRARDPLGNTAQEVLPCEFEGSLKKSRELCFNHKYLTDMLSAVTTDTVTLKLGSDSKSQKNPLFLEDLEQGFTAVVQQMRTDWSD